MDEYVVAMKNIVKNFSGNRVLDGVNFTLEKNSVHGLLGENGAGKSTLMNILGGIFPCDSGDVFIHGKRQNEFTPTQASNNKIAFIHQEIILAEHLSVYENIFLGIEIKKGLIIDRNQMIEKSKEILSKMKLDINPKDKISSLNTSYRQGVEIARALIKNAEIIIMDEPTSSLSEEEINNIFSIIKTLKKQGVSFIFISHKLKEILEICDSYTVLRDGKTVKHGKITPDITEKEIADSMVGEEIKLENIYNKRDIGKTILYTENLTKKNEFINASLNIKYGEIVGVTGLLSDGRSELFSAIFGCNGKYEGNLYLNNKKVKHATSTKAIKNGLAYLPSNRKENGIIKDMSVAHNMSLSSLRKIQKFSVINQKKEKSNNSHFMKNLSIKASSLNAAITSLSGGNQQKAILARALAVNPQILILDNPTQGIDILAKYQIYKIIMNLAELGTAIFILSGEAQEIINLCDRVYVMYEGKIISEMDRKDVTSKKIMLASTGVEV